MGLAAHCTARHTHDKCLYDTARAHFDRACDTVRHARGLAELRILGTRALQAHHD